MFRKTLKLIQITNLKTTTAKRLSVLDAERGVLVCNYENCAYAGKERAPLASDPHDPNLAVCACTNGKGLVFFDLRKQQPIRFSLGTHSSVIRDIIYLDDSWPFGSQTTFVSVSLDGICKIRTLDDKQLHCMDVKHRSNCLAATSDNYSMLDDHGLKSLMMIGGDNLTGYLAGTDQRLITFSPCERPIQKLRYTSNGHFLFTASSEGQVSRYRAIDEDLQFINHLYSHKDDIIDMDISPTDEFIVTSSRDGTVGLQCLGVPSYGWTGFMQLA